MRFTSLIILGCVLAGCTTSSDDHVCDPGQTQGCTCTSGEAGSQICSEDRSGWDPCVCDSPDASTDILEDTSLDTDPELELCSGDADCDDADACTIDRCDEDGECAHSYVDGDGDGYFASQVDGVDCGGPDCDDLSSVIYPDAPTYCETMDRNCDGNPDNDADGDGVVAVACGGTDCVDSEREINPGANEDGEAEARCHDGQDNDCDGRTDCADPGCFVFADCGFNISGVYVIVPVAELMCPAAGAEYSTVSMLAVADSGTWHTVSGFPCSLEGDGSPTLPGPITLSCNNDNGTCTNTYHLSLTFESEDHWTGTYSVDYCGGTECLDAGTPRSIDGWK